jgi:paraquat-inducible protein A
MRDDASANRMPRARELGLIGCHVCNAVCTDAGQPVAHDAPVGTCPRCGHHLHRRRPDSLRRSAAYLIAALILYVPANLYPVMYTTFLGSGFASTIFAGIIDFWTSGSYGIALVIFIASIGVPCVKFAIMGVLLVTCQRKSTWARKERTRMYRLVERIGYWSFLDVVVVAIVSSLVEFNQLSETQPRVGILFFGAVVILTMLSAMSFDARLIWDDEDA